MDYVFLLGSIQALFLAAILFLMNRGSLPNKILLIWMLALGINLLGSFLSSIGYFKSHPHFFGYDTTLVLLNGPLVFLYVTYYTEQIKVIRIKDFLHLLPYVFYTVFFLYQVKVKASDFESIKELVYNPDILMLSMQLSIQLLLVIYIVLTFLKLRKRKDQVENIYSFTEGVDLQWLKNMLLPLVPIALIVVLGSISSDIFSFTTLPQNANIFYGCLSILPFYITFQAIRHRIFNIKGASVRPPIKYSRSNLTQKDSDTITRRLDELMASEKPYLDSYLTIDKLADMLDTHPKNLSQVINEYKQANFFTYVNGYRIREIKERLKSKTYQHYTILAIALDSGFNTKSAFNKAFKKLVGCTPSEFKKQLQSK